MASAPMETSNLSPYFSWASLCSSSLRSCFSLSGVSAGSMTM